MLWSGMNTEFYNLRHRRLLAEHKRLVNLFSSLYIHRWNWEENDKKYSLYKFLAAFCKVFEDRRLSDHIYWYVVKRGCHPTREFMIVLWIYAYCFLFCPEVSTPYDLSKVVPFKSARHQNERNCKHDHR